MHIIDPVAASAGWLGEEAVVVEQQGCPRIGHYCHYWHYCHSDTQIAHMLVQKLLILAVQGVLVI